MMYYLSIIFLFSGAFCFTNSYGQKDLNILIEKSKGTWTFPILKYNQIQDIQYRERAYVFDKMDSSITFISDSSYEVRAPYKGQIMSLFEYNGGWSLTTRYGEYFISYLGLTKPDFKVGDQIESGQFIAHVTKGKEQSEYHLDFFMFKLDKSINPKRWFK